MKTTKKQTNCERRFNVNFTQVDFDNLVKVYGGYINIVEFCWKVKRDGTTNSNNRTVSDDGASEANR
jgi:hypothetical protein